MLVNSIRSFMPGGKHIWCLCKICVYRVSYPSFIWGTTLPPGADITYACPGRHKCVPGFDEFQRFSAIFIVLEHLHICIIISHFHKHWKVDVFERKMRAISQFLLIPLVALVTYGLCWLSLLNFNAIQNVVSVWTTFVRSFITKCRLGVVIMIGLSTFTKALLRLGRWTEYG